MLGTKKTTQKSVLGGIGVALLLCLLMALMPMSGFVTNNVGEIDFVDATEESEDFFKLPDTIEDTDYEYDQALELKGMRDQMTKAYVTEDGKIAQLIANEPINYLQDDGVWDEIDLNVVATANGWEVTKNTFTAEFAAEVAGGVRVQTSQFVDPIITGINPTVVTIDESGEAPMPLMVEPSNEAPTVGGNVIRYPVAQGFDLDYTVESSQLKQNLVIRERPVLQPNAAWLGFSEAVQLPAGYSLYIGDTLVDEAITQTQEELQVRNTETGELLVSFPVPMVIEENAEEPYVATYFVQAYGSLIVLTTAVDTDWLLSEDRVFPLAIDPTIKVTSNTGGYCYVYYAYCYGSSYRYLYRYYSTIYYLPWNKYTFTSNHALPSGATVDSIKWKQYISYGYGSSSSSSLTATVMEQCGTDPKWNHAVSTASCSGAFSSTLGVNYGGTQARKMQSSIWNSASYDTYSQGTGWKTAEICTSATTCSSSTAAGYITSAQTNSGTVGLGARMMSNVYAYTYAYTGGSSNSYIQIVYSGGTDADAPTADFAPYSGITSYHEGPRTFFTTLSDMSGIDTTSANGPTLHYSMNNGTWSSVSATSIGTCSSTSSNCRFKATTPSVDAGDYLEYYWKFQDLNQGTNGANVGYEPATTGSQTTPTPYYFAVEDVVDAGTTKKMTVLTTDVSGGGYNYPTVLDRQMTYYDGSDEYVFEFDTSSCGTGSQSCFYTTSYYFYANWLTQWTTAPSTGYNGMGGTRSGIDQLHKDDNGYLTIAAKNGPQYSLIMLYDSSSNAWAMVGLGDKATSSTSLTIDKPLSGGDSATYSSGYGYNKAYKIAIPGGFTGSFGKFNFNATGSTTSANMLCVTDNGAYYFYRTYSGTGRCNSAYYYFGAYQSITNYKWSGFAMSVGYYGQQASTGTVTYKVGLVAPQPDTFAPTMDHTALADSHSKDRTVSVTLTDAGDPPAGLNVSTAAGVGPTLYYREVGATTWTSASMTQQSGKTRAQCADSACTWSYEIAGLERGNSYEYYMTAEDTSTASSGINSVTSATNSFEVGDPNKMFIIEWRDMGYTNSYLCTYQVVMYDVTNEVEFKYDTNCGFYYDYMMTGYQDSTRTKGETLRMGSGSYTAGANIFSNNYRISTSSTSNGHETFDLGIKGLTNAQAALTGASNGNPSAYYCAYYFNNYKAKCAANIDIPEGFAFEYFGTEFNGSDSNDRIHISRHGIMQLINSGSTSTYRSMGSYYAVPPEMPSKNYYVKTNTLAPNYGGYGSYYCYKTTSVDCGVYYRTMPFEGKGTDVESDITVDTTWDISDSPIRISPSNDYLSISANLNIEPGVVIQVASGKGISFDGACDSLTANGNVTDHIKIEGQAGATWKGIAFTDSCSTGTDDRHQFSYVDFVNTSEAAIAAGSRHGSTPSTNAPVGNFTMSEVTFKNVAVAFEHGSGQGTVVTMDGFSVEGSTSNTACFNFAEDTVATLTEGSMKDCNTAGNSWGGAIVVADGSSAGSTAGALFLENTTITNSYVNLIDVDFSMVTVSNVTATTASGQTGKAIGSDAGAGSEVVLYNFDADAYSSASIDAIGSISMIDVDLGSANLAITPGGASSTAAGPSGANAVIDTLTSGDIQMNRMHPSIFTDINAGDVSINGNAITTDQLELSNFAVGTFQLSGCGWNVNADALNAELVYSSCSSSAAPNTVVVSDGTITHTNSVTSALYARNTKMTVGETTITSTTAGTGTIYLAKASTNAQISLIDVTQDGNDCADNTGDTGNCDWDAASSATIWFGGLAQAATYRMALVGTPPVQTQVWKSGHTVSASVVDGSGSELFEVGSHLTDTNGQANIWVVTGDSNGNTYSDHNIRAFGPAGQNETMTADSWYPSSGDFNIGSSIDLLLEPAPVDFDQAGMDCAWIAQNATLSVMESPVGSGVYSFDSTPMTISADLTLDGCTIELLGSVMKVKSSATNSPVLTLSNGGKLIVTTSVDTGAVGSLKAMTSTYGLHLDIQDGGTLEIDGGEVRDVAQDATTNSAILVGDGATLTMMNNGLIYGASASSDEMATVKVDGGTISVDDSSIINTGNTGTALWVEQAGGNINNIIVKNAAVGIQAYNGAPQVNGFTSTDNTVGVDVYGGMSLPTIYRSTLLSGKATGWETYGIDLSTYLGTGDYLQVGANSIYGGGNAHPTYNYATSKYYMMTDRYNIELEDDAGNSWNITDSADLGYYPYSAADPASGSGYAAAYDGGVGGAPSYNCNYYGYSYGPNSPNSATQDGYMYYLWYYWPGGPQSNPGYPGYYSSPPQFGFDWENIDGVTPTGSASYYPYHYWGYYYTSYHGGQGVFKPPEGYNGLWGNYNICLDYAYSYYMSAGQGARLTFPTVDISASNITKVTLWMDVLHNRADNYQDRLDFVARSGNDPGDLGNYVRESGTALFKDGQITGADTGVEIGGAFAAGNFQNVEVTSPTNSGMEIVGQTAAAVDGFNVSAGTYGVLAGTSASGSIDLLNLDLNGQTSAGIYYVKDITGDLSGTVTNSAGAAFKYGALSARDVAFDSVTIANNAVGIETAGTGTITMTDVTLGNTKDVVITGSAAVDFIEGTVDSNSVEVTGSGLFTRMRELAVTLTADTNVVSGATVNLLDASGAAAGTGITDSSGQVSGLTFTTITVDSSGITVPSLAGYEVSTVAKIAYYYTSSSNNLMDFRYAFHAATLTDASGNSESVDLVDQITDRVCYGFSSTSYAMVAQCSGSLSTAGSRNVDTDGDGVNDGKEYGYYGGIAKDMSSKTVMIDVPFMYLNGGNDYSFNGSTLLATGGYTYYDTQRWYPKSPYGSSFYMVDGEMYSMMTNPDTGSPMGVELGYFYYTMNFIIDNSTLSGLSTITASNGYKSAWYSYNWEIEETSITNNEITHFRGYTELNNAVQWTDICIALGGGDGGVISGNTFTNCAVGVMTQRSPYYSYHTVDYIGADNLTISGNTFNDGGEIADVWIYRNAHSDDTVISGNTFNSNGGSGTAIAQYAGKNLRTEISGNTINGAQEGITVTSGVEFVIDNNTINGVGESAHAGIVIDGGQGDVTNNTLIDSDGGIVLDSMSQPPAPSSSLCTIRSYDYSYSKTCTFTLGSGKTLSVDLETDSWGGEIGIEITLPDGTKDTWAAGSFSSNTGYTPLKIYTDAGSYTIKVTDTYGDGGANIYALEAAGGAGYSGPDISGNSVGLSAGRLSPNAIGISAVDCASVTINSADNTITLSDNAIVLENCDLVDDGSILSGDSSTSTSGINSADGVNTVTLDGTTVSGYDTGVDMPSGTLNLMGDASLAGDSYGVHATDTTVIAINAAVDGGTSGTGLYVEDSPEVWVYPLDASGDVGVHVVNSPFRWDGGVADATTALKVDDSVGSVENMTWTSSTTQIDAGANAYVTSIGNSLDDQKLIVDTTATIDEANLFSMDSTHLTATPANEVALLIKSTDGTRASYVSTSFQPENMVVDGDDSDWNGGNALNPSGYAMPGVMSGDGTNDMSVTYIEGDNLYFGLTGEDLTNSDLLIYISTDGSGSTTGYNGMGGAHTLPVPANYVLWADSDSSYDLYSYGFLGWGPTTLSQDAVSVDFSGNFAEISIPFSRMGGTPSQIDVVAIVQGESTADVSTVHPTQTIDSGNTLQSFSEYITVELTHDDLLTGSIADEVLVYRTYKGSSTPSVAKDYDVMIKTSADCAYDWAVTEDLSMATNANVNLDMERACPVVGASLADITVDEDSGAYTFSLTNMADDVQDDEASMSWTSASSNVVAHDNVLVDWNQNGHQVTITPLDNQFGIMTYSFEVTDSNGLTDSKNITFTVDNVNDAPVICNIDEANCMPLFSEDELYNNILPEGFGSHTKFLGDVSNATRSYIRDMANEQSPTRQVYTWGASVPTTCIAFSAEVNAINELVLSENTNNELGGTCTVSLTLSDDGAENQEATVFDVDFSVSPVNDAPVILDWNASMTDDEGRTVSVNPDNGSVNSIPWKLSVMEDDTNAENLTFSLAAMKNDVDHNDADLTWQIESTDQCVYGNYFEATIVGDDLVLDLVPDATTNGFDWEIDYLNDNGIHQIGPTGSDYCQIRLVLRDTASAPSYVPNYDTALMPIADYAQGVATQEIGVRVERVRELVADYGFSGDTGFNFNGVTNIMTGTYVPTTIDVTAGGDEGPYTYDHMLAITFHTDGHSEVEQTRYYAVPAYGTSVSITEDVYITKDTTNVWVEMDVKTCLANPCDILAPSADRFQTDTPASHRSNNQGQQGADWSKPGQYGSNATQTSERRPLLEDSNWCNNMMSSLETAATCAHANQPSSTFEASGQNLPTVVGTIGAGAVPSFAPSIIAVSLAGIFVSALALSGRRDEDEEEMEATIVEDELAVSPVIATILMVAITVVLSGVIYVWASSLAETDVKGVPRVTFDIEDINGSDADDGHWRISVRQSETDLATQAVEVRIMYTDASGSVATYTANLADTNDVYGFNPANSDAFVTFVDQVNKEGTRSVSTFNTGDEVYVRTHAPDGTPLEDVTITLKYAPANAQGAVLKEWTGLAYNLKA